MSLEGRLNDFTLEEILQLIALQQKTGVLNVDASYPMVLYFEAGELVSYRDRRGTTADPLQVFLRKYGYFSSESWEHVDFIMRNSALDLTEISINEGLLSPEDLARVQQDAAQEHLNHGMLLRDGRYHFTSGREGLMGLKGRVRMKVEGLLMEAARRIDEMPVLQERYGGERVKVRRTDVEADTAQLSVGMRHLLSVCGKESTVKAIVASAKMAEFDTLQILEELRQKGLVHIVAPPTRAAAVADEAPEDAARRQLDGLRGALAWSVIAVVLAAITWVFDPTAFYRDRETKGLRRAVSMTQSAELRRIDSALFLFHSAKGHYPKDLQGLIQDGYLTAIWVERVERDGRVVRYSPTAGGTNYSLELGPAEG
jgi:hypothetical protein